VTVSACTLVGIADVVVTSYPADVNKDGGWCDVYEMAALLSLLCRPHLSLPSLLLQAI
jgi:hypothetical protein